MSVEDWSTFDGELAATQYSRVTHVTPANVHRLEKAWELHTGDMSDGKGAIPKTVWSAVLAGQFPESELLRHGPGEPGA